MSTLRVWNSFEVTINGVNYRGGSRSTPIELSVSQPLLDATKLMAAGGTWTPWGGQTPDAISDFDFGWIESDVAGVQLEIVCDRGGEVGKRVFCFELQAGKPFLLFSDNAYASYTTAFAAGALDVIDQLMLKNPAAATSSANVRVALFT